MNSQAKPGRAGLITPLQMRMARAALNMTTRGLGAKLGISANAVSRFERGDERVISVATAKMAEKFFCSSRVFFGPKDGVSIGEDVFTQDRWLSRALFQLLDEAGIKPSSAELLAAAKRRRAE